MVREKGEADEDWVPFQQSGAACAARARLAPRTAADAQVQPQLAQRYFEEATKLCERDAGRLWGVSLCGPMVIFDPATGTRATSHPEPEGPPPRFPGYADGPVTWGGLRWFAFPLYMLPEKDADTRQQLMLHGLFHRIQPELGFMAMASDGFNEHLDTLEGRVWLQLEWRALRRALESSGSGRAKAIADALAFRRERRRLFPAAADNERRDEIREGLASYTGVAAWANSPGDAAPGRSDSRSSRRIAAVLRRKFRSCLRARLRCAAGRSNAGMAPTASCHLGPWRLARLGNQQATDDGCCQGGGARTMAQGCEQRRSRAIGRSRSASPSCVDASLMGPC